MVGDEGTPPIPRPNPPPGSEASAQFGHPHLGNVNIQLKTDTLNLHASNIAALERLAQHSPTVATEIIASTNYAMKVEARKYVTAAVTAGAICLSVVLCSAYVVVNQGFWAGIAFFLACVAAAGIVASIFTGKAQDLSWTVGLIPGRESTKPKSDASDI